MRPRLINRVRGILSFIALVTVIFNTVGFYQGFLRIRLTNEGENPEILKRDWLVTDSLRLPHLGRELGSLAGLPTTRSSQQFRQTNLYNDATVRTVSLLDRLTLERRTPVAKNPSPRNLALKSPSSPCVLSEGRARDDGRWFDFSDTFLRLYVYSAFVDDRSSAVEGPLVRIIALASELEKDDLDLNKNKLFCVFRYNRTSAPGSNPRGTALVPMESKARPIGFGWQLNGLKLKEYIFTCPSSSSSSSSSHGADHSRPVAVTVVSSRNRLRSVSSCVPIEVPAKPRVKEDVAVCVQASYGQLDPHRLIEWLELQRILGVSRVGVYDLDLGHGPGLDVLRHYDAEGLVELRKTDELPIPGNEQFMLHGTPAINDCMYRYMHAYRWVLVIDFDEVLVPRKHSDLRVMMRSLEATAAKKSPPPLNFIFLNQYYFLDSPPDPNVPPDYTVLRYRRTPPTSPQGYAMKSYVDPLRCAQMHNHYCMGLVEGLNETNVFEFVDPVIGTSNHYKTCHLKPSECRDILRQTTQDDVIMTYSVELRRNVERKVKAIFA